MLKIRLQRVGRKHEPTFRVVLTDSKNGPKSGKFLEVLGSYDSRRGEKSAVVADRIKYWMSKGVKLSETMHNLLINKKVIEGKKINVLPRKSPIKKEEAPKQEGAAKSETKAEAKPDEAPKEVPKAEEPKA